MCLINCYHMLSFDLWFWCPNRSPYSHKIDTQSWSGKHKLYRRRHNLPPRPSPWRMFRRCRWRRASPDLCSRCRGNNVKLVMHQISVDKIENPCYWINRCTFDMVLPSILSTQYWESLIFSPCIVIGEIEHFCVPRGQRRFFIKIEAKASICSWEVCFCCCTH